MADHQDPLDRLAGLDEPRPLPAPLRTRLEDALLGAPARPLSAEQTESLTAALRDPVGELLTGLDAPRPLPASTRSALEGALVRRRFAWQPVAAALVAAAAVVVGVIAVPRHENPQPSLAGPAVVSQSPTPVPVVAGGVGSVGGTTGGTTSGTGGQVDAAVPTPQPVAAAPLPAFPASSGSGAGARPTPTRTPRPARPVVDAVAPMSGGAGTWVTLTGSALTPALRVTFDGVAATRLQQVSAEEVRALAPAHAPGAVDVVLTTAGGSSAPRRFLYLL